MSITDDTVRLFCGQCGSSSCSHVQEHITRHADAPLASENSASPIDVLIFAKIEMPFSNSRPSLTVPVHLAWSDDPRENKNATATWTLARCHENWQTINGIVTPFEGRRIIRQEILSAVKLAIGDHLHGPWGCKSPASRHDSKRNVQFYKDARYGIADSLFRYVHGVCLLCHEYGQGGVQGL